MTDGPALFGRDLFGSPVTHLSKLREKFVVPPFSVLSAASGEWQARKRAWLKLGIRSELGRPDVQSRMKALAKYMKSSGYGEDGQPAKWIVTSIFDPVLCECAYRWWCPRGGQIIDPFAGGSVRGIVAGALGFNYWGCDLSADQIAANRVQGDEIDVPIKPTWVCGDSAETMASAPLADFLFSCPPYGNLEVYSKDPNDISNMSFGEFAKVYEKIICESCDRLQNNRFACFVVGDYRDGEGMMRNFVSGTISCFRKAGLKLYNEMILATVAGTAMVRAARVFNASRKCIKTHQNILCFVKGSWKEASAYLNSKLEASEKVKESAEELAEIEQEANEEERDLFEGE